jgi:hypothetical protein
MPSANAVVIASTTRGACSADTSASHVVHAGARPRCSVSTARSSQAAGTVPAPSVQASAASTAAAASAVPKPIATTAVRRGAKGAEDRSSTPSR